MAPSDLAVCPTSRTIRNFAGTHIVAASLEAEGFTPTGPRAACFVSCSAACFTPRRFAVAADFAKAVRPPRAGEVSCFGEWPGFDEPLKTSDSQPASLASIGNNTKAAIAATTVWRHGQPPKAGFVNFFSLMMAMPISPE